MDINRPRVLVFKGRFAHRPEALEALGHLFELDVHEDYRAAQQALRDGVYHAIFADVGDFLPLERTLADQQASLVLNTIGEGVVVVDGHGRQVWMNERMRKFPPEVYDRVRQICVSAHAVFEHQVSNLRDNDKRTRQISKKFGFQAVQDRYFEAIVSPVVQADHVSQVVAVVWDATSGRRLQQKIDAIDAAGRELVRIDAESLTTLNVGARLKLLEEKIIRFTSDLMHFDHFCIRLLNKRTNKLELVIAVGLPPEAMDVDLYAQPEGNGISGYVAATGRSYICHDVEKDPRYIVGLDHAKSSLTVPLRLHDQVIGMFNVESQQPGAFTEDDRQFSEIFGRYVAMALHILDLLVVERYTTSGRLAENVVREIATPINDIVSDARDMIESLEDDEIKQRLLSIVENAEIIRDSAKHAADAPRTILGARDIKANFDPLLAGKVILVCDDEPNIRNTLDDILSNLGCHVYIAEDGKRAVQRLEERKYDLIISDIRMPHRTGYEIFSAARRLDDDVPVILMTGFGYDPHHSIVRATQEGLSAVLFKPFKAELLLTEIRKALGAEPPEAEADNAEGEEAASNSDSDSNA